MQIRKNGSTSNIERVVLIDVTSGTPKTGLAYNTGGLTISTIADNESTATTYTANGSTTETITTLGTFAAPTATKCRFKEVDSTNHPGLYELQIADARYSVSNAKYLDITITLSGTIIPQRLRVRLAKFDLDDSVRAGLTALPNANAGASTGLPLSVDSSGRVDVLKINGTSQTARDIGASVLLSSGTGTGQVDLSSGQVKVQSGTGSGQISTSSGQVLVQSGTGTGQLLVTSGIVSSDMTKLNGDSTAAANLSTSAKTMETGTAVTGTLSSTQFTTNLSNATDSAYVGRIVVFTSGSLIRQVGVISAYVGASKTITVSSALTGAPSNGDGIIVV